MYNEIPTLTDFQDKWAPLLTNTQLRCALCDRPFRRITGSHLRSHADFLLPKRQLKRIRKPDKVIRIEQELHPGESIDPWTERPETLTEIYTRLFGGTSLLNAVVEKTFRLYAPSRSEWTLMEHLNTKAEWITMTPESTGWPWGTNYLTRDRLKEHFLGLRTVGVKPRGHSCSKVIVFDIDAVSQYGERDANAEARAKQTTRALVRVLMRHQLQPHVVCSGGKGYHIILFFNEPVQHTMAKSLYEYVVNHPDVPRDQLQIELLPFTRAVKLPLGIHWPTRRFAIFVDPLTLVPVSDPYRYYLGIRPMDKRTLDHFVAEPQAQRPHRRNVRLDDSWSSQVTELAYRIGIQMPGTRHNTTLRAAAYVCARLNPSSFQEFYDAMMEWSQIQYQVNRNNIRTSWSNHIRDLGRITEYVWKHRFTGGISLSVDFTAADVHWVVQQTNSLAAQQLLLAALYQYRLTGGSFYFGFHRMQDLTGLNNNPLSQAIKVLRDELGLLRIVENYSHGSGLHRSKTRKYTLSQIPENDDISPVLVTVTPETWRSDLWFQLLHMLYTPEQIRQMHPFAYHRILQVGPANQSPRHIA